MKKFYKENRVFVILMGIALVCIAIIITIFVVYLFNSTSKDKYGNRLDGIDDVKIEEEKITEMEDGVLEMDRVQEVTIDVEGKIVYFVIDFENDATLEETQNVAISCLEFFTEEYLNFYDIQFMITKSTLEESTSEYPIIGYRKSGATGISWSNNAQK